jgi:hypothetical protein
MKKILLIPFAAYTMLTTLGCGPSQPTQKEITEHTIDCVLAVKYIDSIEHIEALKEQKHFDSIIKEDNNRLRRLYIDDK